MIIPDKQGLKDRQTNNLLEVTNLKKYFPIHKGFLRKVVGEVKAVDGVSFSIKEGEILGLVGESGCGKTTTGRLIMRGFKPTGGGILFYDRTLGKVDLATIDTKDLKSIWRNVQMIFQDPFSSLNPRKSLLQIIGEPLINFKLATQNNLQEQVAEILRVVGLRPEYMTRFPHAFSGGQRQRISVARALVLKPQLIVCDEPVSALDVSIQAQVLNLLKELQVEYNLSYLFISHDLSVVKHICNKIAVMYVGKLVETADTNVLFSKPYHPYTEALLSAISNPDPRNKREKILLEGDVPDPSNPPKGCYFHPRCKYSIDKCKIEIPVLSEIKPDHFISCHKAEELNLKGI